MDNAATPAGDESNLLLLAIFWLLAQSSHLIEVVRQTIGQVVFSWDNAPLTVQGPTAVQETLSNLTLATDLGLPFNGTLGEPLIRDYGPVTLFGQIIVLILNFIGEIITFLELSLWEVLIGSDPAKRLAYCILIYNVLVVGALVSFVAASLLRYVLSYLLLGIFQRLYDQGRICDTSYVPIWLPRLRDHYDTLELRMGATKEQVKKAYEEKKKNTSPANREELEELDEAYKILSRPIARHAYDIQRSLSIWEEGLVLGRKIWIKGRAGIELVVVGKIEEEDDEIPKQRSRLVETPHSATGSFSPIT